MSAYGWSDIFITYVPVKTKTWNYEMFSNAHCRFWFC